MPPMIRPRAPGPLLNAGSSSVSARETAWRRWNGLRRRTRAFSMNCGHAGQAIVARETAIGAIAAEDLVAAVPREHDRHVLARRRDTRIGRHRGLVGKRLVEPRLELRQELLRVRPATGSVRGDRCRTVARLRARRASPTPRPSRSRSRTSTRCAPLRRRGTTTLESMPPDRKKPSGTSATIWSATAESISARKLGAASSSVGRRGDSGSGIDQKRCGPRSAPVAGSKTSQCAGGNLKQRR